MFHAKAQRREVPGCERTIQEQAQSSKAAMKFSFAPVRRGCEGKTTGRLCAFA
jgi:hypothetical protein